MEHPYGWLSLAPPVVAVALAIATQRILLSILVGLFAGAMLTCGGNPIDALVATCETHLWPTFIQESKLRLFCFTMSMGATIGVIHAAGGMLGLVQLVTPLAKTPRRGQLTGWLLGLMVFFDDYANTLLLGGALRPIFDRLRISREKLAYLVDSTAAPVAGLALVSTWIAVEIAYVEEGLDNLVTPVDEGVSAIGLFVACLPYRFYVIQALLFVPILAIFGREFGPMLQAERTARKSDLVDQRSADAETLKASHWSNAVIPLAITLTVVTGLLWITGVSNLGERYDPNASTLIKLRDIFGSASSGLSLMYGGVSGLVSALLIVKLRSLLTPSETTRAIMRGLMAVLPAVAILWFAGAMSRMTGNKSVDGQVTAFVDGVSSFEFSDHRLYTGEYLSAVVLGGGGEEPSVWFLALLPTGVFLLSAAVAFCTGTSFGTMGLIVPMVVPLAFEALGPESAAGTDPLLLASLGGVLAGAIFGDHCSPISDTTILSSQASECDHMAHVRTQLPYAMLVACVAVALGTIPIGFGVNVWLLLPLQTAALIVMLLLIGKKVDPIPAN